MKMSKSFLLVALFFILMPFMSCTNPSKVLPSKDGEWDLTITEDGDVTVGKMDFDKEGKVTITIDGDTEIWDWSYSKDNEKITLSQSGFGIIFEVKEAKRNYEKWQLTDGSDVAIYELER